MPLGRCWINEPGRVGAAERSPLIGINFLVDEKAHARLVIQVQAGSRVCIQFCEALAHLLAQAAQDWSIVFVKCDCTYRSIGRRRRDAHWSIPPVRERVSARTPAIPARSRPRNGD